MKLVKSFKINTRQFKCICFRIAKPQQTGFKLVRAYVNQSSDQIGKEINK
jgi:hypothetical protein